MSVKITTEPNPIRTSTMTLLLIIALLVAMAISFLGWRDHLRGERDHYPGENAHYTNYYTLAFYKPLRDSARVFGLVASGVLLIILILRIVGIHA